MGASFTHKVTGRTPEEAFNNLVTESEQHYGGDAYNVGTCVVGSCTKTFDKFNNTTAKEALKFIEDNGNGEQGVANYIDMGVTSCIVTTIKKRAIDGGKPQFKMQYCIYQHNVGDADTYTGDHFDTKTDADKRAMELALKNDKKYLVSKEYVNVKENTNSIVTETVAEYKAYKIKPVLKEVANRKAEEYHTYYFYGWSNN